MASRAPKMSRLLLTGYGRVLPRAFKSAIMPDVLAADSAPAKQDENAFGKYRQIASLGHGGMADVFLAVAQGPAGFNKLQVLKRLRANLAEDPDFLSMFLDEARLAARLNHPNVVQTNEVGEISGEYFIAMEYLEGQPFNRILNRAKTHPAPPGVMLRIVADALAGLHYAHELTDYDGTLLNVVHRDASPHNIFVTYDGQTKLVDFGIAKAATRSSETRAGTVKGKVSYMAPEQARCGQIDRRADIFVLGVVLWEILAGRKVWQGRSDIEILDQLMKGGIPSLTEVRPDVPAALQQICERALAHDPAAPYATAAEMRADLLEYLDQSGQRVGAEQVGSYVGAMFADKRAEIRRVIERQLSQLATAPGLPTLDAGGAPNSTSLPRIGAGTGSYESSSSSQQLQASIPPPSVSQQQLSAPPQPTSSPRWPLFTAAAASAIVVAGALLFFMRGTRDEKEAEATASPPTTPVTQELSVATAQPTSGAATVELRIRALPESATIYLDDAQLPSNPFEGKFPADGIGHRLRAEASGHVTQTKLIVFNKDAELDIELSEKDKSARSVGAPQHQAAPPPPQTAAPTAPAPTSAAATPTAPGKPKRKLDGSDPWSTSPPTSTGTSQKRKLDASNPWN